MEALKQLEYQYKNAQPYNLIISDMMMPHINGLELSGIIKAHDKFKNIEIILLTSVATDIRDKAKNIGVTAVLNKPARQSLL